MDNLSEIAVFVRVVALGSFTAAAGALGLTPSGVSRVIARLEDRLGVRLLNRTTRSLTPTDEGTLYYDRGTRILADLEEADAAVTQTRATPRGRLRVELPILLADFIVGPALPDFLTRYPEVAIDLTVRDKLVDLTAEGLDVAVRLAPSRDSDLRARRLAHARSVLVASPDYLARLGRPESLDDLRDHACIVYLASTGPLPWRLKTPGGEVSFAARGQLQAASGNVLTRAALAGLGVIQTFTYHVADALARGELVTVLDALEPEPRVVQALFAKEKADLPKVRTFLDFLSERFAALDPDAR